MTSVPKDFDKKKLSDPNYKGEDFNVNPDLLENAFDKPRGCTDLFCAIFFTLFLGLIFYMIGFGYVNGAPAELLAPIAPGGAICGYNYTAQDGTVIDATGFPYLYIYDTNSAFANPTDLFAYTTCAKTCPTAAGEPITCLEPELCAATSNYGSYPLINYCVPNADTPGLNETLSLLQSFARNSPLYDFYQTRWIIFGSVFLAIFFAFCYIKFMDWCALQCAWLSVITVGLGLIGSGTWCWIIRNNIMSSATFDPATPNDTVTWLWWGAIILWTISGLYVLCLVCNQKSLRVSIRIIEVAGDFVADTKRVLFVPVGFFFFAILVSFAWLWGYICVSSVGTISVTDQLMQVKTVDRTPLVNNMLWIMIFGYFWIMAFVLACNEFVIIVSAATWYFSDKTIPDDDGIAGDAEVYKGFKWIRNHFGSLAMGSLLVAIVWMIRFVFEYVSKKME